MNIAELFPTRFRLRSGAGGGDPSNGLCYMEMVAFIAGERITAHPECASSVITRFGIQLNDWLDDADRQKLLPLAWATSGTACDASETVRLKILCGSICDIAEMILSLFEARFPQDQRPRLAISAARSAIAGRSSDCADCTAAIAAARAAIVAARAADATIDAAAAARAADAAAAAAAAAAYVGLSIDAAAAYVNTAFRNAAIAVFNRPDLRRRIMDRAIEALREAIEAGPNGGLPDAVMRERIEKVRDLLPLS